MKVTIRIETEDGHKSLEFNKVSELGVLDNEVVISAGPEVTVTVGGAFHLEVDVPPSTVAGSPRQRLRRSEDHGDAVPDKKTGAELPRLLCLLSGREIGR